MNRRPWNVIRGQCNVITRPRNVIVRPWNVNRGTCSVIMGQWNVNRGTWNVNRVLGM